MVKVLDIDILAEEIELNERIRKGNKEIRKQRIAEMVASGVDKKIAKVMVDAFISCGC